MTRIVVTAVPAPQLPDGTAPKQTYLLTSSLPPCLRPCQPNQTW